MKLKLALLLPALMVAFMSAPAFAEDEDYKQTKLDWHNAIETFMQKVKVAEGFDYHASENSNLWAALDVEVKRLADEKENVNKGSFFFLCKAHKKVMRQFHSASYDLVKLGGICASSGLAAENWVSLAKNNRTEIFRDLDSIKTENNLALVKHKTVYVEQQRNESLIYQVVVTGYAVDCNERTASSTDYTYKSLSGDVVFSFETPRAEWKFDSEGYNALGMTIVCIKSGLPTKFSALESRSIAAAAGDAVAQYNLGLMYDKGEGVPKDAAKAVEWWQKAAAQGYASAQFNLGVMYANGIGIPKDAVKAAEWFQKAAAQGHAKAQANLGVMYANGDGVSKNRVMSYAWSNLAAAQGDDNARENRDLDEAQLTPAQRAEGQRLASNWKKGDTLQAENQIVTVLPTTSNSDFDLDALSKKARNGDPVAQFDLGMMYDNGDGVPKDAAKAVEWWLKAAAQGYADAQHNLGLAYSTGEGVTRDRVRAYAWFNLAAAQGDMSAKENLDKLEAQISPAQRAEAQRISSIWKKGDTFKKVRNIPDSIVQVPSTANNTAPAQKNASGSARWKSFDKTNDMEYFIDTSSIRKADGLTYAWEKIETNEIDKNNAKVRKSVLISLIVNCNNHTFASSSMTVIDKNENGDAVNTRSHDIDKLKYHAALPDSPGDKLVNFACAANVAAQTGGSSNSSGSGFFVSSSGYLLTNNHVVNGCAILKIRDSSKIEHDVTVVATDAKSDLALLKTNKSATFATATFHANDSVESGESVVVLGYPLSGVLASEVNVSFGYVSATAGLADDTSKLQISAPVQPGNSGGPLLDQAGNLIGVVVAKLDALKVAKAIGDIPQNINFAVKGEVAQVFLKAHKVKFKTATVTKKLENTDIANRGRAFTVLVECYK